MYDHLGFEKLLMFLGNKVVLLNLCYEKIALAKE